MADNDIGVPKVEIEQHILLLRIPKFDNKCTMQITY